MKQLATSEKCIVTVHMHAQVLKPPPFNSLVPTSVQQPYLATSKPARWEGEGMEGICLMAGPTCRQYSGHLNPYKTQLAPLWGCHFAAFARHVGLWVGGLFPATQGHCVAPGQLAPSAVDRSPPMALIGIIVRPVRQPGLLWLVSSFHARSPVCFETR